MASCDLSNTRTTILGATPGAIPGIDGNPHEAFFEQCQVVVFIADDLGFLGPGIPDLVTELCPPQDTA